MNRYIQSLYFTLVTLSTVGYGDIRPSTLLETAFSMFMISVGCVIYADVTANVANLSANMDVVDESFAERNDRVKSFMKRHDISEQLQSSIVNYYHYLWQTHKGIEEDNLLANLPEPLRLQVGVQG